MQQEEQDIIRYFLDELSPVAQEALMNKLVKDEGLMALFKEYEKIFDKSSQYRHQINTDAAFEKVSVLINDAPEKTKAKRIFQRLKIPAVLVMLLFFVAGIWAVFIPKNGPQKRLQPLVHTLSSSKGQKAVVLLADGSKVTLNAGSRLFYPEQFTGSIRMVKLEGEAFFEVEKDPKKPFCVLSGSLLTRVLGTSFNIKNFGGSSQVYITVATGHVAVDEFDGKKYARIASLLPEQQLLFNTQNHSVKTAAVNSADVYAWKENRLVFNNTPLNEIAESLQRLYGMRVIYPEKTAAKTAFSARFKSNASLTEVMRTLALTGRISYSIRDSVLHIKNKKR